MKSLKVDRFLLHPAFVFSVVALALPLSGKAAADGLCPEPWVCAELRIAVPFTNVLGKASTIEKIRAGYFPETGTFRGNILYFEGLGDSMLNHHPLFSELSADGYRVIAFDYMGQGGSSGMMNRTRIRSIPWIGQQVWKKFARETDRFPQKTIIGWSTGGLAAYLEAANGGADRVVLIAPGIAPKTVVGEGIRSWPPNRITVESLTTAAPYSADSSDPHIDPIRPDSPVKVPGFAVDLLRSAYQARRTPVAPSVQGFVLLSGEEDTYVNAEKTKDVLSRMAPHFQIVQYEGALHEIDNERDEIRNRAVRDILEFLTER